MRLLLSSLALVLCLVRPGFASDAKSFFAYLREVTEPASPLEGGREGRQTCSGPLCFTFSLNGVSNFTFNIAQIPTTFPIACGGDDRNYCNYPDLPLMETSDLDYYSRRPIPSGRCPDGYTKMPTFDCLNIAPALFETTCCVFMSTVPNVCSSSLVIDAMWTLCNGSVYISSGAYAWRLDQNFVVQQGPITLAALTGGSISRDLSEAEVQGDCNVQFFNMADQYWITDYATGSLSSIGPNLVSQLCLPGTPGIVFGTGSRGSLVYKIDGDSYVMVQSDGYNFQCGGNTTCSIAVIPPGCLGQTPQINATAATYLPARDLIAFIIYQNGANQVVLSTRQGVCQTAFNLNLCPATSSSSSNVAPLVYIPYPVYPIFQPAPAPAPSPSPSPSSSSYGSSSGYGSSSSSSYSAPSPSSGYGK
jgi:hypothetical protein